MPAGVWRRCGKRRGWQESARTHERPGVSRREGAGGESEKRRAVTAWGGLPSHACDESRRRRKQVRHGGLARRGERASGWTTH
jgi:hypothetical protein